MLCGFPCEGASTALRDVWLRVVSFESGRTARIRRGPMYACRVVPGRELQENVQIDASSSGGCVLEICRGGHRKEISAAVEQQPTAVKVQGGKKKKTSSN